MSNVASLELRKELYELSDGNQMKSLFSVIWETKASGELVLTNRATPCNESYPAYNLGYILRKLPRTAVTRIDQNDYKNPEYIADSFLFRDRAGAPKQFRADTPEDAACKLAIQLFKQGILTTETEKV